MLYLVTGSNGSAKTLFTLRWVRDMQLEWQKKGIDRPVYFDGCDIYESTQKEFGWQPCDPTKWMDLPDKSIIIVDEAQRIFPTRGQGKEVPDFEMEISISHRKRGFDFFIITQHPNNINTFIRNLVGSGWHRHLKRIFGMKVSNVLEYNYAETSCQKPDAKNNAHSETKMRFPEEVFDWYKSAELHTAKRSIPKVVYMTGLAMLVAVGAVWYFYSSMMGRGEARNAALAQNASEMHSPANRSVSGVRYDDRQPMTQKEYVDSYQPRIQGFPHSAPRYDRVTEPVTAPYPAACVTMESKGCVCYSQQGTRLDVPKATCLSIVDRGFFVDWDTKPRNNSSNERA